MAEKTIKLQKPFWYDFEIGWRQLYWIEQFLSAKYYVGRNPEIDVAEGKLIFYRDGTVRLIKKDF
jgi:hypothetical protein